MTILIILRYVGSIFSILGYTLLLNSCSIGVLIQLVGNLLMLGYFIKARIWDALILLSFFSISQLYFIFNSFL